MVLYIYIYIIIIQRNKLDKNSRIVFLIHADKSHASNLDSSLKIFTMILTKCIHRATRQYAIGKNPSPGWNESQTHYGGSMNKLCWQERPRARWSVWAELDTHYIGCTLRNWRCLAEWAEDGFSHFLENVVLNGGAMEQDNYLCTRERLLVALNVCENWSSY